MAKRWERRVSDRPEGRKKEVDATYLEVVRLRFEVELQKTGVRGVSRVSELRWLRCGVSETRTHPNELEKLGRHREDDDLMSVVFPSPANERTKNQLVFERKSNATDGDPPSIE